MHFPLEHTTEITGHHAATGIRVVDVVKEFGASAALRGVNLLIQAGELMALLGPSGSGKTTLLRVIAGLEMAEQGSVFFGAEDATNLSVQQRQIGFVFQHYALFKHLTVFSNVAYGLRARPRTRRPPESTIRKRVLELLGLVQLEDLEHRYPAQLSGGQRQRVALARALAIEPRVLLLDEPFGALDAKVRKDLRRWLRHVHDQTGQTTIFVTHDQDEALELADRVAILNQGRIEQVGTPDEIHDRPATAFVMSFIGETACIPVRMGDGRLWIGQRALSLPASSSQLGYADLYVRPGDVAPDFDGSSDLQGTVRAVRRVGGGRRAELVLIGVDAILEIDLPAQMLVERGSVLPLRVLRGRLLPTHQAGPHSVIT
jgi:sulfate transport system ATP-binding protein